MFGLFVLAGAALAQCPVEHARYTLRTDPTITAHFRDVDASSDWPNGVALEIRDQRSGDTSWWLPSQGGTNGMQYFVSTTDVNLSGWKPPYGDGGPRPHGYRDYIGFNARYDVVSALPRSASVAPAHMLFPNSASAHDDAFPIKQFFDLVSCA